MAASIARHHAEWLSLLDVSGPFLSMPVLMRVFPQGLDAHDLEVFAGLQQALAEWEEERENPAIHTAWVRFILGSVLGIPDDYLLEGPSIPAALTASVAEHGEMLRPDLALLDRDGKARMLVMVVPPNADLEKPLAGKRWKAAPATRLMELLHAADVRVGLVTNGERWMLVDAPRTETAGYISWYASLWTDERITLQAFRSLLGFRRFFGVPEKETLEAMLAESASDQAEVTDQLGRQVRRAVEILIAGIDRIDQDRGRTLLEGADEKRLYEAALTVMMRLVFLLAVEERGLLPLGDPLYDDSYAVSTLRAQLRDVADRHGEEVLERRNDAWARLLAGFRAVHGGIEHDLLRLPAYGGALFDPDRFPFLEGRPAGTAWREAPAHPLPIHNRTVLHLLEALQVLQVRVSGGGPAEARLLSFRALDIEQIGHVYEGLLDHTAVRAEGPVLGLAGNKEPEVLLPELEALRDRGQAARLSALKDLTGRSERSIGKGLEAPAPEDERKLRAACGNDEALLERVRPWAGLLREDSSGYPVVIPAGGVYVTRGSDRRSTGTHYTPRGLTEPIVRYTLEPLVYAGPAEGKPNEEWRLRPARELLDLKICDMAMGSGAFLVQACRYLAERLVEAWEEAEGASGGATVVTPEGDLSTGSPAERPLPRDAEERLILARRAVADRCLYGVDINPMAVEMAKLSLWLVTVARERPFTFLDHALRCGDSLLGVSLEQLRNWNMEGKETRTSAVFGFEIRKALERAVRLREQIECTEDLSVRETEEKARLLGEAQEATELIRLGADLLVSTALLPRRERASREESFLHRYILLLNEAEGLQVGNWQEHVWEEHHTHMEELRAEAAAGLRGRRPYHWPLEFPEVFTRDEVIGSSGFDAIVGNPPFMGGQKITGALGTDYRDYLVQHLGRGKRGSADLCAYFFLRAGGLLRRSGQAGLLATNTIAQGDTREVGLEQLEEDGFSLPRAVASRKWPGEANLEVAHVWLRHGGWKGPFALDDAPVPGVTPYLTSSDSVQGTPCRLAANAGKSFQGSIVLGMGFVLTPEEAEAIMEKDPRNRDVLFPYLNGEDLNSRPDQSPSRWVINFHDWPLERAETYPDCMAIVREKVKPERDRNNDRGGREAWWRFLRPRPELYATIAGMERVLAVSLVSNHVSIGRVPASQVFAHKLAVFPLGEWGAFAAMQSHLHYHWAWQYSSTMRVDLNYSPSDCFETFPFPDLANGLGSIGCDYYGCREALTLSRGEGLTKIYNRFHDPDESSPDIDQLRELHVQLDRAVADAYGWTDLDLGHGFHTTKQGVRFTISEPARREVLGRLLRLNHERYEEEVRQGLHEKGRSKGKKARRSADAPGQRGLNLPEEVSL